MSRRRVVLGVIALLVLLPATCIAGQILTAPSYDHVVSIKTTSEYQDAALLDRAWALDGAARYDRALQWQPNLSLCGPTSLANVFASLAEPSATPAAVLQDSGFCWTGYCIPGLTLDELGELARANTSREVTVIRDFSLDEFREHLRASNKPDRRYIINFHRGPLFGAGGGHHSPIGGYLESEDLVFVLDVNESYKPWVVKTERLYEAVDSLDSSSGKKRGLLLIQGEGEVEGASAGAGE